VLSEKRRLRVTELKRWLPEALTRLADVAGKYGGPGGDLFAVYYGEVSEDSDGPVEVCVPIAGPAALPPDLPVRPDREIREAYLTITRAQLEFPQILSAFDAVATWISAADLTPAGPPREVYPSGIDIAAAAPGDPVCQIAYPIPARNGL
jgi:hypothetical protein